MTTVVQESKQDDQGSEGVDRRKHPRTRPQEPSRVVIRNPQGTLIVADLLDVSPSGFRISYEGAYLNPGSWIGVLYPWGEVPARVVWTAVTGIVSETGVALHTDRRQPGDGVPSHVSRDTLPVKNLDTTGTGSGLQPGARKARKETSERKLP
jgi:hypothetical protein